MARQATLRQNAEGVSFDKRMMLYDSVSKLLWVPPDADAACIDVLSARSLVSMSRVGGFPGWRFPAN